MGQLEDMGLFIRIIEAGSISKAAEQLNLAKSAVSKRLNELEIRLGTKLINRTTRTSNLTEAGKLYYERANQIIDDVAELNGQTSEDKTELKGMINLAAPLSFGLCHLSKAIDIFLKQHPTISINIDFSDRQIDLIEEGLDLAFRITRELNDSTLIAHRIAPIKMMICASPDYIKKYGEPNCHRDLTEHRLLRFNLVSPKWLLTDPAGKEHTLHINADIAANNGDFLHRMAVSGHGIVILPTFLSWRSIATNDLVQLLPGYTISPLTAYAVYPQNRYLSKRTRVFIEFLKEHFGDNPYWDQAL